MNEWRWGTYANRIQHRNVKYYMHISLCSSMIIISCIQTTFTEWAFVWCNVLYQTTFKISSYFFLCASRFSTRLCTFFSPSIVVSCVLLHFFCTIKITAFVYRKQMACTVAIIPPYKTVIVPRLFIFSDGFTVTLNSNITLTQFFWFFFSLCLSPNY